MSEAPSFFQECVNAALEGIEADLAKAGFARAGPDLRWKQGRWNRSFLRAGPWKNDFVDVIYPRSSNELARTEMALGLRVELNEPGEPAIPYDGVTVSYLAGRNRLGYPVPRRAIFKDYRRRKFGETILTDLSKALPWFEKLGSIDACLARLKSGETNGAGPNWPGGNALRVLEAWQARQ